MAASDIPKKLLVSGGIRTVGNRVDHPKLHCMPVSFNSGKAVLSFGISSIADKVELIKVFAIADNYTVDVARLNANMTVPTVEIDDQVVTDSLDLAFYLMEKYPGKGDQQAASEGKSEDIKAFAKLMAQWDEYQLSYGNMGSGSSDMANDIRIINLKTALKQVLDSTDPDKDELKAAYVEKIANIRNMKHAISGVSEERKTIEMDRNWQFLMKVCAEAERHLKSTPGSFLFGEDLTTADCFLLPLFPRLDEFGMLPKLYAEYPSFESYWESAKSHPALRQCGYPPSKLQMVGLLLGRGLKHLLGYKLGFKKAPALPDDVEKSIEDRFEQLRAESRG